MEFKRRQKFTAAKAGDPLFFERVFFFGKAQLTGGNLLLAVPHKPALDVSLEKDGKRD